MERTTGRAADFNSAYSNVDRAADPAHFVGHMQRVAALDAVQAYKQRTFALLAPRDGSVLLDAGCGPGSDAIALAGLVGRTGRVVGVDVSETMIGAARQQATGQSVPVEFRAGDLYHLDFADASFDGCRADRVFHHLADPRRGFAELVRVTRPGGRIVLMEPDFDTLVVDAPDRSLTRMLLHLHCDQLAKGWMGRQLPALFVAAGLRDVAVEAVSILLTDYATANQVLWLEQTTAHAQVAGVITAAERERWLGHLRAADAAGRFFGAATGFLVSGRKP